MNKQTSTKENINRLIKFRKAVYAHVFQKRCDALFNTLVGGDKIKVQLKTVSMEENAMMVKMITFCCTRCQSTTIIRNGHTSPGNPSIAAKIVVQVAP